MKFYLLAIRKPISGSISSPYWAIKRFRLSIHVYIWLFQCSIIEVIALGGSCNSSPSRLIGRNTTCASYSLFYWVAVYEETMRVIKGQVIGVIGRIIGRTPPSLKWIVFFFSIAIVISFDTRNEFPRGKKKKKVSRQPKIDKGLN